MLSNNNKLLLQLYPFNLMFYSWNDLTVVGLSGVRPCVRSSYVSKSATNHYDILYAILYDMSC
jgi:hypothetical protein